MESGNSRKRADVEQGLRAPDERPGKKKKAKLMKPCWKFANTGSCTYGDACRFAHDTSGGTNGGSSGEAAPVCPPPSDGDGDGGILASETASGTVQTAAAGDVS